MSNKNVTSFPKHPKILKNFLTIWQYYQSSLFPVGRHWTILERNGRYWEILGDLGWVWEILEILGM